MLLLPTARSSPAYQRRHGEAEATRLLGRSDPDRWTVAVTAFEALGQPYPAAYERWREAVAVLTAHGPRARAAAALRQADEVTGRLGASPLRHEIQRLARRARINLADSPHAPTDQPAEPSPAERLGLTRREREVLALVAAGLTNQQIADTLFISSKTHRSPRLQHPRQIGGSRSGGGGGHRPQGWPGR